MLNRYLSSVIAGTIKFEFALRKIIVNVNDVGSTSWWTAAAPKGRTKGY